MDEFAESLERDHVPAWSQQYLDYRSLQQIVDTAAAPDLDEDTSQQRKNDVEGQPALCFSDSNLTLT